MTDESAILIDWHMYWQSGTLIDRLPRLYVRKIDWEKEEAPVVEFCLFPSQKSKHLPG